MGRGFFILLLCFFTAFLLMPSAPSAVDETGGLALVRAAPPLAPPADLGAAAQVRYVTFAESDDAFVNPFKGYAPRADGLTAEHAPEPGVSLAFALLSWAEFEPERGTYDFAAFEAHNNLDHLAAHDVRLIVRFVCDLPGGEAHMDIPQWLYDETGDGVFYDNAGVRGYAPDYANPVFLEAHRRALAALGARYDASPNIAFVQLGSLGQWGEWHNAVSQGAPFPDEAVTDVYVTHYLSAFPNTALQMRRPYEIAKRHGIGLYHDMMGVSAATEEWLGWIADAGMEGFSRLAPSGGEFASTYRYEDYFGERYAAVKQMVRDARTTYLGGFPPDAPAYRDNGDDLLKTMGYRFTVRSAFFPETITAAGRARLGVCVENIGIAPFYQKWYYCFMFFDKNDVLVETCNLLWDARSIPPGRSVVFAGFVVLSLPPGEYAVKLGLVDPATGRAGVRLANREAGGDLLLPLGTMVVRENS